MPHIKNALIRFRIIDRCIRNQYKPYPSKLEIREACEDALYGTSDGENICDSTIEKDLFAMRMEHDAPCAFQTSLFLWSNHKYSHRRKFRKAHLHKLREFPVWKDRAYIDCECNGQ